MPKLPVKLRHDSLRFEKEGDRCYASPDTLPDKVDSVVIIVPPAERVITQPKAM